MQLRQRDSFPFKGHLSLRGAGGGGGRQWHGSVKITSRLRKGQRSEGKEHRWRGWCRDAAGNSENNSQSVLSKAPMGTRLNLDDRMEWRDDKKPMIHTTWLLFMDLHNRSRLGYILVAEHVGRHVSCSGTKPATGRHTLLWAPDQHHICTMITKYSMVWPMIHFLPTLLRFVVKGPWKHVYCSFFLFTWQINS